MCVCGGGKRAPAARSCQPGRPAGPRSGPGAAGHSRPGRCRAGKRLLLPRCKHSSRPSRGRAWGRTGEVSVAPSCFIYIPPPPPLRVVGFGFFFPLKSSVLRRFRPPGERLTCTTPRRGRESPPQRRRGRALSGSRGWAAAPPRSPPQSRSRCFYGNCSSREPAPSPGRKVGAVSSAACLCGAGGRRQSGRG